MLRFGVHLPNSGGGAVSPDALVSFDIIREISITAEKMGYDALWANEHITQPSPEIAISTKFFEPLILLSALSGYTSNISLGSAIVILPFRDPFVLAKEITTLDVVSAGRFSLGVGVGRFQREYTAHGKSWCERGEILEEQLVILRELLTGKPLTFHGKYYTCDSFSVSPIPQDSNRKIPIILGGQKKIALRRSARLCDGIMPGHVTPEDIRRIREIAIEELAKNGRDASRFKIYSENIVSIAQTQKDAESKFFDNAYVKKIQYAKEIRKTGLVGTPDTIKERIKEYESSGLQELVIIFADENVNDLIHSMTVFADEVMPAFK
jgi:probable F420-dependent oxidoreductase